MIQDVFRTQGESLSYKLFVFYLSSSILGLRSERTFPTNIKCAFWVFLMFLFAGQIIIEECLPSIEELPSSGKNNLESNRKWP